MGPTEKAPAVIPKGKHAANGGRKEEPNLQWKKEGVPDGSEETCQQMVGEEGKKVSG